MNKYLLIGGYVTSKDGDRHYINSHKLCELYQLNPTNCEFRDPDFNMVIFHSIANSIILRPRPDGDYINYLILEKLL